MSLEDDIVICANCGHFKRDHNKGLLKHQGRPKAHCAFVGFPCPCPGFEPLGDTQKISRGEPCPPLTESE